VMTIPRDLGAGSGDGRLDAFFELLGRHRHSLKRSEIAPLY
jgi:hypothetical protein